MNRENVQPRGRNTKSRSAINGSIPWHRIELIYSEAGDRKKQKHYQAWQVINTAQGKGGNGGRIDALQELNADRVSLTGVDIAGAFLQGLQLRRANLVRAKMAAADVRGSDLEECDLQFADLQSANFRNGSLQFADDSGVPRDRGTDKVGSQFQHRVIVELRGQALFG